jgi:hypothetical protein
VRTGRLTAFLIAATALSLLVATAALARLQTRHVVVVTGSGFRLSAWDKRDEDKSLCFKLQAGKQSSTQCETLLQRKARVNFASFTGAGNRSTLLGGVARKNVTKVVATFANGHTLTMRARTSTRYKGRLRGRVKFWAGRYSGTSRLKSLTAKTASGTQGGPVMVPPPPEPSPPPPCGCQGPPVPRGRICPATPCPE